MNTNKKRILTGDRPTGPLHLGHYIGTLKNRAALQDKYDCFFIIADLHTLTTNFSKEKTAELNERELIPKNQSFINKVKYLKLPIFQLFLVI
ncbi:MAG: Tryptophan-tRNA ligase [Candidatus Shapirobacteria bacterium GW2011_GWF1_38_23]|nr:MAG: Tryptophan-tRNA ligase [Candidatus Shapirobacteria bacterium GW2011_GWF1_38_23]